jgi:hypothetical protein
VLIVQLDSEHRPRQNRMHHPFDFDMLFFHKMLLVMAGPIRRSPLADQPEREASEKSWGRRDHTAEPWSKQKGTEMAKVLSGLPR